MEDVALQRVKHSIIFDKAMDTKTNPQLTEGYLLLQNCEVFNVTLQKSQGVQQVLTVPNGDLANSMNVFSSLNQLAVVADQEIYAYDPLDNILVDRGSFASLNRTVVLTEAGNIIPLFFSEYGSYGVLVYSLDDTYYIRIQNLVSVITINIITFVPLFVPSEVPVGLIATSFGVYLYTQETVGGIIDEYFYAYTAMSPAPTTAAIIATAVNVSGPSNYPAFKVISTEYDDDHGYLWFFFVPLSGQASYIVRNLYGDTVVPLTPVTFVAPYSRAVTTSSFETASLNSFYSRATEQIFAQFNNTITVFNTVSLSVTSNFVLPTPVYSLYSQSICYCGGIGTTGSVFVLREDLQEYNNAVLLNNRVYPFVITYDLTLATWTITDTTHLNPPSMPNLVNNFGIGFVVGSLWPTKNNVYFAVMSIQYTLISGAVFTAPINRHGNYYIIDYQYNLVDFAVLYVGSHFEFFLPGLNGIIHSIPLAIVDAKPNLVALDIPYTFLQNTQVEIAGGQVSFDSLTYVYDVAQENPTKLVSYDRGQTGYFGIENMFMLTQNNAEYAQFLDYPGVALDYLHQNPPVTYWSYTATYEYVNANGELFRSAPAVFQSAAIAVTLPAGPAATVYFTLPSALEIKKNISIKIWRTTVNSQTFYLLVNIPYVPGTTTSSYTDPATPDATIILNELGYFNGGVLGEIPFSPFNTFTLFNNRIVTVTLDNPDVLQYSLPYQPTVGLATTFGFEVNIEPRGGDIVELAVLDDKLIIFKQDYIFFMVGDGADALGNNYNYSKAELVNSPVGCSSKASVIRMPTGIMFQSSKGIWLLDRSLTASYIGAPVEAYNSNTISSATLSQTENRVRFTTEEGPILTYDYYYNTWTVDVGVTLLSTATYQGTFYGMDTSSDLVQIYDGYLKKGQPYPMTIETPWIKIAGLQGFQRVYKALLLGNFVNTNVLQLGISYDFVDQVEYWLYFRKDVTQAYGLGNWGTVLPFGTNEKSNFEINFFMPRQKCQSIKFTIMDGFDNLKTDTGNSFTITEIMFIAGIKSDSMKLPASRRV